MFEFLVHPQTESPILPMGDGNDPMRGGNGDFGCASGLKLRTWPVVSMRDTYQAQ